MRFPKILDNETMHKLETHEDRISALENHKKLCDELHEASKEHRRKNDDAMNNLTQSNLLLAQSIDNMNMTITEIVRDDRPVVKRSKMFQSWFDNMTVWFVINRNIGKWMIATILLVASLAAALKQLGWW